MANKDIFPCPRKKGKGTSAVWKHFGMKLKDDVLASDDLATNEKNLDLDYVYCLICGKRYRNHQATTTMRWHIDNEHRSVSYKEDPPCLSQDQQKITNFVATPKAKTSTSVKNLSQERTSCIDGKLLSLLIDKMLPLSTVEHSSFVAFANELEPAYKVPGRKAVIKKLKEKYRKGVKNLTELVADCQSVALTHDSWTSLKTESFDTVTAHFIDVNWELHSTVLRTSHFTGPHTGDNIGKHLTETITVWKVKDPTFVTDNAANEKKAIRDLGYPRVGCYGHRLNLVVKKGLENKAAKKLIEKGRSIVTFFHTSTTATEVLLSSQSVVKPLHLIQDVCTRWNSSLDMIVRLEQLFPVLTKIVVDGALGKCTKELEAKIYSYSERDGIQSLITVLEPFKHATEMLSSDKIPTQGLVLPAIKKLNRVLIISDNDSEMIKAVKSVMKTQLDDRTTDSDLALISCKLTPSVRHMSFATEEEKAQAVQLLHKELLKCYSVPNNVKAEKTESSDDNNNLPPLPNMTLGDDSDSDVLCTDETMPSSPKKIKLEEEYQKKGPVTHDTVNPTSWLEDIIFVSETKGKSISEQAEEELHSYLAEPPIDASIPPLNWWKENALRYPKLSILAKKYLAIPASSVSLERVFSLTGNIISKKRARLRSDLVDIMVFLNKNKQYC